MGKVVLAVVILWTILTTYVTSASAGYCYKSKQCASTCYKRESYKTGCNAWWSGPCTKYRTKECCPGYTGSNCNSVAICNGVTTCPNGGSCISPNVCSCRPGFSGAKCSDINECSSGQNDCTQECTNTEGSFTCTCRDGFTAENDGRICTDIDECATSNGQCSDRCDNSYGSYACACSSGYQLDTDRRNCIDVDECLIDNGGCYGLCVNTYGSFTCDCDQGFRLPEDGSNLCEDIDECKDGTSGCTQTCENTVGAYNCSCHQGYTLADDLHTCLDDDDCEGVTCLNGGVCIDRVGFYTCSCKAGYEGDICENDVNECLVLNGGCEEMCMNNMGSYSCTCSGDAVLDDNGKTCSGGDDTESVFRELGLLGQLLPKGCAVFSLERYHDVELTSTSIWYRLASNHEVHFTFGIVSVERSGISLPLSLTGAEIRNTKSSLEFSAGMPKYSKEEGIGLNIKRNESCLMFDFTAKHMYDFVNANSFLKTMFENVYAVMPNWLQIRVSETELGILSIEDLRSDLIAGDSLNEFYECKGAPVNSERIYNVFRFATDMAVGVYEQNINLPKPLDGKKFCLIVDISGGNIVTVFLMLPPGSRNVLEELDAFKLMKDSYGTRITPRGIGLSADKSIMPPDFRDIELWNGETSFTYSQFSGSNVWIGADIDLVVKESVFRLDIGASVDLHIASPKLLTILPGMFIDEWTVLGRLQSFNVYPSLKFDIFGVAVHVQMESILSASLDAVASIGGDSARTVCGESSNPAGLYMSFIMDFNLFRGIPILEDWVFSGKSSVRAFLATDQSKTNSSNMMIDVSSLLKNTESAVLHTRGLISERFSEIEHIVSATVVDAFGSLLKTLDELDDVVKGVVDHDNARYIFRGAVELFQSLWNKYVSVKSSAEQLIRVLEAETKLLLDELFQFFRKEISNIGRIIEAISTSINAEITSYVENYSGFGIQVSAQLNILGLSFPRSELEIVYAAERLYQCSKYKGVYALLNDEPSLKVLVRIHSEVRIGLFVILKEGYNSIALSTVSYKFVYHMQAVFDILGMKVIADGFITTSGFHASLEGNIWNAFFANIKLSAEIGKNWRDLIFNINGRLIAGSSKGPDFGASYLDGLRSVLSYLGESAVKRLTAVQGSLSRAQDSLTSVQEWFSVCQAKLRGVQRKFDAAFEYLETTKQKLDDAKKPYEEALDALKRAQKDVDKLCRIKSCGKICVPGMRLTTCKKRWVRWPCLKWTNCMFKVPNPLCIAQNTACMILRGLAYAALEAAKIFVRIPMLAYDVAKAAMYVAQIAVDASRIVLIAAEGVLEVAKLGVDAVIIVLEAAKQAVEVVKFTLRAALQIVDYLIQFGLQSLVDVRNCGFELQLSTADASVFEVSCEINPLRLGWTTVKMTIDFRNPLNTIWYAAKNTATFITNLVENVIGKRKRRDVTFLTMLNVHKLVRKAVQENITMNNAFEFANFSEVNESSPTNITVETPMPRVDIFRERCVKFTRMNSFLLSSVMELFEMTNESVHSIGSFGSVVDEIDQLEGGISEIDYDLESLGIDQETAFEDFNLTEEELASAMEEIQMATENGSLLHDLGNFSAIAKELISNDMETFEKMPLLTYWIEGMDNETLGHFDKAECTGFDDCVMYSFSVMYELFMDDLLPDNIEKRNVIVDLEDRFLSVLSNQSKTAIDLYNISIDLKQRLLDFEASNLLCSTAPEIVFEPLNQTVLAGSTVTISCTASGDPRPHMTWFHNNTIISGRNDDVLVINNTKLDNTGVYRCLAGNIVANVTSSELVVDVKECGSGTYFNSVMCVSCERGWYQHNRNEERCLPCPGGTTTETVGATHQFNCIDIDECDSNEPPCQDICMNTFGTYMCGCREGFSLFGDGRTCGANPTQTERAENNGLIIGCALAAVVLMVALGAGVWVYKVNNVKKVKVRPVGEVSRVESVIDYEDGEGPFKKGVKA